MARTILPGWYLWTAAGSYHCSLYFHCRLSVIKLPPVSFTADLYKPFFRKKATEKETLFVGRVLVLVLSLIAFVIANSKGSGAQAIMDMVENAWGAFGASFGPTILLSLFWKRFNY